jgi:hypothetical protein
VFPVYTDISIETLLFGSNNLTDEINIIVFWNVQNYIYHSNRLGWYEIILCTQDDMKLYSVLRMIWNYTLYSGWYEIILCTRDDMKLYSVLRMIWNYTLYSGWYHTFALNPLTSFSPSLMYTFIIYVTCCHFHIYVYITLLYGADVLSWDNLFPI